MREIKEEAKRRHEEKLRAYGGKVHHRARGGKPEHPDKKEDEKLIHEEVKPGALKHEHHRAGGGMIPGGPASAPLSRKRGKPKGTNVNIALGKPDAAPMPPLGGAPMPARPPAGAAPGAMKRGGHVGRHHEKHRRDKHEARD